MNFKNLFKSFSYLSISNVVVIICSAYTTVLLAQYLEPRVLGILLTGEAFVEMFSFFFTMGFKNSILEYANRDKESFVNGLNTALGNALLIRLFIAVPTCVLIFILAKFSHSEPLIIKVVLAYILVEFFKSFTNIFGVIRKALDQFKLVASLTAFNKVVQLLTIIVVFKYLGGIEILLVAYVLAALIKFLVSFFTTIKFCKLKFDFEGIPAMIKQSFLFGVFDYMEEAQSKIDRLMINYILGPSAVAFYSIPSKLNRLIKILPKSIKQLFLPQLFKFSRSRDEFKSIIKKLILLILILAIPISLGIYFLSKPVLAYFFSAKYSQAIELAPLFAFIAVIWFLNIVPSLILASRTDHKGRNIIQFISIILNILLNLFFINKFGIAGAIWATILANFIKFIMLQFRCVQVLKRD
ncbi:MAG: oligosaccharide flippase family protein [Candidatus Caenarcaniphilales bacterium]|nr:oligosaccharide flippase family protein [Candidatus Caenarcaniphilales bacterium]